MKILCLYFYLFSQVLAASNSFALPEISQLSQKECTFTVTIGFEKCYELSEATLVQSKEPITPLDFNKESTRYIDNSSSEEESEEEFKYFSGLKVIGRKRSVEDSLLVINSSSISRYVWRPPIYLS